MTKQISFRSRNKAAVPAKEFRLPGSKEHLVSASGEINANDRNDLLHQIGVLLTQASAGNIASLSKEKELYDPEVKKNRREVLQAAYYSGNNSRKWAELGSIIAADLSEVADREGFMRRFFLRSEVSQGQLPRIRIKHKNVVAVEAASVLENRPVFLRDKYRTPPEFYIDTNIRVEEREIAQGSGDILEEKFAEAQEAIMVVEDRKWKSMVDSVIGTTSFSNDLQILAGGLTPTTLSQLRTQVGAWNLPTEKMLMAADVWDDLIGQTQFSQFFDPVTKYEMVMTGKIGTLLGLEILTDSYREPNLRVMNAGEIYIISSEEMHGTYTDRGPVQSQPVDSYPQGSPARGWYFWELISMTMHNPRSYAKGIRA